MNNYDTRWERSIVTFLNEQLLVLRKEYEHGFIDGMQHQMQSSVDKAVNGMTRTWVGLTDEEIDEIHGSPMRLEHSGLMGFVRAIETKLREKNIG